MRRDFLKSLKRWAWIIPSVLLAGLPGMADANSPPIDGYFPLVGFGLTDEFNDDFIFSTLPSSSPAGATLLGSGGTPFFDVALLDTGAGFSLVTDQAFDDFGLGEPWPGEPDGFAGTSQLGVGGAGDGLSVTVNDPTGLYVSGLQDRTGAGATLVMDTASFVGQTNVSTATFPPLSPLPNIVGLSFAGQYATHIQSDQPQVFRLGDRTVRTPSIRFEPLGSGGGDLVRKAPLELNPSEAFQQPPAYLFNILDFDIDKPHEDPISPTVASGALFLTVDAMNDGASLTNQQFFFDTGASVTVVSQLKALQLGFDVLLDEPGFTVSVIGAGGTTSDVPGFFLDELTVVALGGSVTATNVPIIVLDLPNPADPSNVVDGLIGTNVFSGRNLIIDPNPTINAGPSPGVYISDPVTSGFVWSATAVSAAWSSAASWDAAATPDYLATTEVRNTVAAAQEAVVAGEQQAWDVVVAGDSAAETMTVRIDPGAKLTTFSGVTVRDHGVVRIADGVLDTQYVDIRGGRLTGAGRVETGSGPIDGQVESIGGAVAPGDGVGVLTIDGRFSSNADGVIEIEIGGLAAGSQHDRLVVEGDVALGGALSVELVDLGSGVFAPQVGDAFDILTYEALAGEFATLDLPLGYDWGVDYLPNAVRLTVLAAAIPGDFDFDGDVDDDDFGVFAGAFGGAGPLGDFDADGDVDDDDFGVFAGLFGTGVTAIPEPASGALAVFAALAFGARRRR